MAYPKALDTSYYEMAHDYLEDYRLYDEEATAGEIRRKAALARLYEKGKAHRILKRMDNPKGFLADLEGEIRKYHTKKNYERGIAGTAHGRYGIHFTRQPEHHAILLRLGIRGGT